MPLPVRDKYSGTRRLLELGPDAVHRGEVLFIEGRDELPGDGVFERVADQEGELLSGRSEADQRDPPAGLVGASRDIAVVDEALDEARGAGRADASELARTFTDCGAGAMRRWQRISTALKGS